MRKLNPFILAVLAILTSAYLYLGFRLISPLELGGVSDWARALLWIGLAALFGSILWLPLVYWQKEEDELDTGFERAIIWTALFSMAFLSFLFGFTVLRDLLLLPVVYFGTSLEAQSVMRILQGPGGTFWVVMLSLAAVAIGFMNTRALPRIVRRDVPLANLPEALRGFKIAQISDLHIGDRVKREFVQRVVDTVNGLQPDLIALTGDIGDGPVKQLLDDIAPLGELKARYGAYYVTGNHEYYSNAPEWIGIMQKHGILPLLNEHRVLHVRPASLAGAQEGATLAALDSAPSSDQAPLSKLVIAGVTDLWAGRMDPTQASDPRKALSGAPEEAVKILLAHQPKVAYDAEKAGYDLQLSGHTHGGQFFPWIWVIHLFQPFVSGLNRTGRMWVYVNRGTGFWGPPIRLGSPMEITEVTLQKISDSTQAQKDRR